MKKIISLLKKKTYLVFSISIFLLSFFVFSNNQFDSSSQYLFSFLEMNIWPHFALWFMVSGVKIQLIFIKKENPIFYLYFGFVKALSTLMIIGGFALIPVVIFITLINTQRFEISPILIGLTLIMIGIKLRRLINQSFN